MVQSATCVKELLSLIGDTNVGIPVVLGYEVDNLVGKVVYVDDDMVCAGGDDAPDGTFQ